jgi:hypothetical protein
VAQTSSHARHAPAPFCCLVVAVVALCARLAACCQASRLMPISTSACTTYLVPPAPAAQRACSVCADTHLAALAQGWLALTGGCECNNHGAGILVLDDTFHHMHNCHSHGFQLIPPRSPRPPYQCVALAPTPAAGWAASVVLAAVLQHGRFFFPVTTFCITSYGSDHTQFHGRLAVTARLSAALTVSQNDVTCVMARDAH